MRIIIEGVDKSGKSTLIEKMKNQFEYGMAIKNMIKPRDASEAETERIKRMYEEIEFLSSHVGTEHVYILDRFYQSEIVYSILRGNDRLQDEDFMSWVKLREKANKRDTLLVLVETDAQTVAKRFKECNEDFVKEEQIEMLQKRYNQVFEMSTLPKIKLDTTQIGIENSLGIIKKKLEEIQKGENKLWTTEYRY